jgi:hypothetical protein
MLKMIKTVNVHTRYECAGGLGIPTWNLQALRMLVNDTNHLPPSTTVTITPSVITVSENNSTEV